MTLDPTTFAAMLKTHYAKGKIMNVAYDNNVLFAAMKKKIFNAAGGLLYNQPVGTSLVGQGSSTFATANAATTNQSNHGAFSVPFASHYRVPKIDNGLIERTLTGSEDAFEKALDETDKGLKAEGNWVNFRMYRSRGGAIGRMTNTGFATAIMTVDDPAALYAVQKNDVVRLSATDGTTGAVKTGSLTVLSVQHPTQSNQVASITFTANISTVTSPAVNDYIFLEGDFGLAPTGFADYIPDNATAAATTLHGFVRSDDSRLGGAIVDGTNQSVFELITDMLTASIQYGGSVGKRTIFCNPFAVGDLVKQLDGKWIVQSAAGMDGSKVASVGFKAVEFNMAGMEATLVLDRMCPVKRVYSVDLDDWTMFHAGMVPAFLLQRQTGNILKPSETADAWECRIGEYFNLATGSPHKNAVGIRG